MWPDVKFDTHTHSEEWVGQGWRMGWTQDLRFELLFLDHVLLFINKFGSQDYSLLTNLVTKIIFY